MKRKSGLAARGLRRAAQIRRRIQRQKKKDSKSFFPKISARAPVVHTPSISTSARRRRIKVWRILVGVAVLVGSAMMYNTATRAVNWINDASLENSAQRSHFYKKYGTQISAWKKDFEEHPRLVGEIATALRREWIERPFNLTKLRIVPEEFYKKTFVEQLSIHAREKSIAAYARGSHVSLKPFVSVRLIIHEIKHVKHAEVDARDPSFRKEWLDLCRAPDGKLLFTDQNVRNRADEDLRLGFVDGYARTSYYEDVASFCETVERNGSFVSDILKPSAPGGGILLAKLRLAQKYGLVPRETLAFGMFLQKANVAHRSSSNSARQVYRLASTFLRRYPRSVYAPNVYFKMLQELNDRNEGEHVGEVSRQKRFILQKILEYPHAEFHYYTSLLELRLNSTLSPAQQDVLQEAILLYQKRRDEGDVLLPIMGVNDFLREKGIL